MRQTIDRIVDFFHRFNSNTGVFNPTSVRWTLYDEAVQAMDFSVHLIREVLIGAYDDPDLPALAISGTGCHGDEIIISR